MHASALGLAAFFSQSDFEGGIGLIFLKSVHFAQIHVHFAEWIDFILLFL